MAIGHQFLVEIEFFSSLLRVPFQELFSFLLGHVVGAVVVEVGDGAHVVPVLSAVEEVREPAGG